MNLLKKIASILILTFFCLSCDVEKLVSKFTDEACAELIEDLYEEYDNYILATLSNENLSEEEKSTLIEDYEDARDEEIQEVEDTCEEELNIF